MIKMERAIRSIFSHHPPLFRDVGMSLILALFTLSIYAQVRHHSFISYDDPSYVHDNPHINSGLSIDNIHWAFTNAHACNWHPITWISHMIDVHFFGLDAGWQHMVNVIFHVGSTILLFWMFNRITGQFYQSSFIAALFALHPLHVESVAWISERKDVLSTFFLMLVLWSYVQYVKKPSITKYLNCLIFYILGLFSKPMLVTVPFLMMLLDYWPLQRQQSGSTSPSTDTSQITSLLHFIREKIPFLALAIIISVVTLHVQQKLAIQSFRILPISTRIAHAIVTYVTYIEKMLYPENLVVYYPYPRAIVAWQVVGSFVLLLILFIIALRIHRNYPYIIVGLLWYCGTLIPVIGIIQVGSQAMADRYTYVPLIGLFIIIAWGATDIAKKLSFNKFIIPLLALMTLSILSMKTWHQIKLWQNDFSLFTHALNVTENNHIAHEIIGNVFYKRGKYKVAIDHYSQSLKIAPYYTKARNNLAGAFLETGRISEAIEQLYMLLETAPRASTHFNLGNAFVKKGDLRKAASHYLQATRIDPNLTIAYLNLGIAYSSFGEDDQALLFFEEALRIDPDHRQAQKLKQDLIMRREDK
ncbi:tetratricopeptide repeat protein [candidate division CSSED10-310 bacterium]|uniref:Tetratricopeptide repeat protein n=1 Tax=candidate division CSSED10-310 bacterium TaxID=2855610 RepID=A0ABV6Z3V0_UNCC1